LIPGEENEYVEALEEEQFYQDHIDRYLHPDFDETKYSCKGEMRKKGLFWIPCQLGLTTKRASR